MAAELRPRLKPGRCIALELCKSIPSIPDFINECTQPRKL
ncbi:hypothetical protein CCACVL1_04639 [Corchorus capsularis]|uniref:Uncharacterized protein n=1 Tax=Corchorus capsularis TaxID=210143 RepID=A0A1R3JQQ4_COCAP|nr:hypothetical protein CCACVL1_04639 [Corchorus capsularis]